MCGCTEEVSMKTFHGQPLVRGQSCIAPVWRTPPANATNFIYLTTRLSPQEYWRIRRCRAVICEDGGVADHAAVVCRIIGRPLIRLDRATRNLKDGEMIGLDGVTGDLVLDARDVPSSPLPGGAALAIIRERRLTLQVSIVGAPEIALVNRGRGDDVHAQVQQFFVREELLWATQGLDPFRFTSAHGPDAAADFLAAQLLRCLRHLRPGQLLNYRSLDWRAEYEEADGALQVREPNPDLGLHGIRRLLVEPMLLIAELKAIRMVQQHGFHNLIFSLPFLIDPEEVDTVRQVAVVHGVQSLRLGLFIETAAAVSDIDELLAPDIAAVYIGTKDLTQMILACDRGNTRVQHLYDCTKRPVRRAVARVVDACNHAQTPVVLFTLLDDLPIFVADLPSLHAISICCGDYQQLRTLPNTNPSHGHATNEGNLP
jgi:phosphohistidine swiveling domain-containing protein